MPSPGVMMPIIRSPGTAPPLGAKRTGRSPRAPRIGIEPSASPCPGTFELQVPHFVKPNPAALALGRRRAGGALLLEVGMNGAHHIAREHFAAPDRDEPIVA